MKTENKIRRAIKLLSGQICANCVHVREIYTEDDWHEIRIIKKCYGWAHITGRYRNIPKDGMGCIWFYQK